VTGIVLGPRDSIVNRTSKVVTAWEFIFICGGKTICRCVYHIKKVLLYSMKEIKSGQGDGA